MIHIFGGVFLLSLAIAVCVMSERIPPPSLEVRSQAPRPVDSGHIPVPDWHRGDRILHRFHRFLR